MSCAQILPVTGGHVTTSSTSSWTFLPTSDWMLSTGLDTLKAVVTMRSSTNLIAHAAYQTAATRTDAPDDWTTGFASDVTTEGAFCTGDEDISSATQPDFYVRFGIAYKVTGGQTFAEGDVAMQTSFDLCGRLAGARTIDVNVSTTNTYDQAITDWMPAHHVSAVKFAVLMTGVEVASGSMSTRPTMQLAPTTTAAPASSWTLLGSAITAGGTNHEACTGELALTTLPSLAKMWVRFGLQTSISSGSKGIATITAVVAVRS